MKLEIDGQEVFVGTGSRPFPVGGVAPGQGAVLFVHGAGMDHTVWSMPARYFARQGFAVLAPDLPGHGMSAGPALASVEAMVRWLLALMDALQVGELSAVGHSMGSLIVHALAAMHPQRVHRAVLLGASLPMPVTGALLSAAADDHHAAYGMANAWSYSTAGRMGGNPVPGMFAFAAGERLMERCGPGVFHADLSACNDFDPSHLPLPGIPVTVVVGTDDRMTPMRAGRALAERLGSTATVRTLPGAGHSMMAECPNEVLDVLIEAIGSPA